MIKLQEKKKGSSHAKEGSINVFTYSDSIAKNLAFFPFTDVQFKMDKDFSKLFIKKNAQQYMNYHNFTVNFKKDNVIIVDGFEVGRKEFVAFIKEFSDFSTDGKLVLLHLNFDKELTYGDYIKNKLLAWQATNKKVELSSFEFIYDANQLPPM